MFIAMNRFKVRKDEESAFEALGLNATATSAPCPALSNSISLGGRNAMTTFFTHRIEVGPGSAVLKAARLTL